MRYLPRDQEVETEVSKAEVLGFIYYWRGNVVRAHVFVQVAGWNYLVKSGRC